MWKRVVVIGLAGSAWAVTTLDVIGLLPAGYTDGMDRVVVGVAVCATGKLMLLGHQRPIGAAYDLGYQNGRRDQMRKANTRQQSVSPIRRAPLGVSDFNYRTTRKQGRALTGV